MKMEDYERWGFIYFLVGQFELDSLLGSPLIFESARPGVPKRDKFKVQRMDEKYEQTGGCVSTMNRPPDLPLELNFGECSTLHEVCAIEYSRIGVP